MGLKFMGQVKYLSHNKSNYFVKGGDERLCWLLFYKMVWIYAMIILV